MTFLKFLSALSFALQLAATDMYAQGTFAFQNLDFEAANLAGYLPGSVSVPIGDAFPGWSAYVGGTQIQQVWYDTVSVGTPELSIVDPIIVHLGVNLPPLQGSYSAVLVGGLGASTPSISQTGLVPANAKSLVVDMSWGLLAPPPIVMLDGERINMLPVKTYTNYKIYAGNIATFAGRTATLSFSVPAFGGLTGYELDNIIFSTAAVPEPGSAVLLVLGASLFAWRFKESIINFDT